ncbi:hypothetical protein ACWC5F_14405 [Streptomyces sp. NPDC001272]
MADEKPVTARASISDCFSAATSASGPCPTARRMCWSRKITGICRKVDPLPRPETAKATRKPAKNDQKLPWATPEGSAKIATTRAPAMPTVALAWIAKPSHSRGPARTSVLKAVNFRSPKTGPMKVYRIRKVPPVMPGTAVSQNSCDVENPKPTSFSLTTVTDQTCHTTKPSIRAGTEIQRLRWATRRPVDCQKPSSSGRQSPMTAWAL